MISKMDRILLTGLVRAQSWWRNEKGQGAFEYILILGGISALVVGGMYIFAKPASNSIVRTACTAIQGIGPFSGITCTGT